MTSSAPPPVPSPAPSLLLDGLAMVESPRWHDGRLWFAHWGTGEIRAVDLAGRSEVTGRGPAGLGWTIDWLPDGRLLVTGAELLCLERDGSAVPYADLRRVGEHGWSDVVVDGRGNVYVASIAFDFMAGEAPRAGRVEHDRPIFGCALGGPDRCTLFLLAADWRGTDQVAGAVAARTGQVLTVRTPAPGVGWT